MAYDETINERIRKIVSVWKGTTDKKMFGGVCHLLHGNMFCGVYKDKLILRLGEEASAKALGNKHTLPFDITGRPMKGWVMVEKKGFQTDEKMNELLALAKKFVKMLPPK
jgi:hypothetical protein